MVTKGGIATLTVTQLNTYVKMKLESDDNLNYFYLRGEISNFTNHYKSGHLYFSLKDDGGAIKAVMFSFAASRLRFAPADGMQVIARGRVSLYEKTGTYQFYAEEMQPDGLGALNMAYEQLKEKLYKEGLFDEKYKKPIPKFPKKMAVITSETGAAVRDILQISARRWPLCEIVLCPVLVQGEYAAASLINALRKVNEENAADVIIIGRGGGSLEDLFAFNDEKLAREIFASKIPVISAVGHETDFTISDFVADLRAPTPSAAAELALPDMNAQFEMLASFNAYLKKSLSDKLNLKTKELEKLSSSRVLKDPYEIINLRKLQIDYLSKRFENGAISKISKAENELSYLSGKLDAISPLKVLSRGYAAVLKNEKSVKSIDDVNIGDEISLVLTDGKLTAEIKNKEA